MKLSLSLESLEPFLLLIFFTIFIRFQVWEYEPSVILAIIYTSIGYSILFLLIRKKLRERNQLYFPSPLKTTIIPIIFYIILETYYSWSHFTFPDVLSALSNKDPQIISNPLVALSLLAISPEGLYYNSLFLIMLIGFIISALLILKKLNFNAPEKIRLVLKFSIYSFLPVLLLFYLPMIIFLMHD